jgi:hypothetical protein
LYTFQQAGAEPVDDDTNAFEHLRRGEAGAADIHECVLHIADQARNSGIAGFGNLRRDPVQDGTPHPCDLAYRHDASSRGAWSGRYRRH